MRIMGTESCSLVNGKGVRFVVFTQGCAHKCPGCHNTNSWSFSDGIEVSPYDLARQVNEQARYIDGVTLSGGDPFYQQRECEKFLSQLDKRLNVWIYTGFDYEYIKNTKLARMADYIVDGRFEIDKKIIGRMYGSSNQHIYTDVKKGKGIIVG